MSTAEDIQAIEISMDEAKRKIARKEALVRLQRNPDFHTIIEKGFLEEHAIRQVMLKSHPSLSDEKAQRMLDNQILAIGGLKQFFINIYSEGMNAEEALRADEKTLEDLHAEALAEGVN